MRIFPTFPPRSAADVSPVRTLIFFLALLVFLVTLGPALVFPGVLLLMPAVLLMALTGAGVIAFALCSALCLCYVFFIGGPLLGCCFLLATLPGLFTGAVCLQKEKPFLFSLLATFGALLTGSLLAYAFALYQTEGQLVLHLSARLESFLRESKSTDSILLYGYMGGLLPLSNTIAVPALALPEGANFSIATRFMGSSVVLNPDAREELLRALLFRFETLFLSGVPGQLLSGSILGAVLSQLISRRFLRARGESIDLPGLRQWFIPGGKGRFFILPLGIAWIWMQFFAKPQLFATYTYTSGAYIAFSAFYAACSTVFALQGLALLDWVLHMSGKSRTVRTIFAVVGYVLVRDIAVFAGMADQYMDLRHLRRPPEDENDDYEQEDDF